MEQRQAYVVTGSSSGVGAATARALASRGAGVVINFSKQAAPAEEVAQACIAAGGDAVVVRADVAKDGDCRDLASAALARWRRIDGLVNNAGIMVIGTHLDVPLEAQLKQLDINLRGVILGVHDVAPRMIAAGGGQIINIASLAGRIPTPGAAVYSATKAGVLALTEALDAELSASGVRVAAVLPSFTNTGLIDGTTPPKLSPPISPEQVAAAVVGLMGKHKAVVTVPRSLAFSSLQWGLLPNRTKRWMGRKTGMDSMFTDFDHDARANYESRTTKE